MALSLDERLELSSVLDELERRNEIESFRAFAEAAWPIVEPGSIFVPGFHIDAICQHLQAVAEHKIRDLIINVPPRHTKSTLTNVLFPAWVWIRRPDLRFIYASNSYQLSKRDSVKCRRLIESDWYRNRYQIKWRMSSDQNEKMNFENSRTGTRLATSVGASIIGQGGDFLMTDDPQTATDIYSDTKRESVITWYNESFSTRANDPKTVSRVLIMQRLHEEDLTGQLLSQSKWCHLVLPAEYEGDKHRTEIGWEDPRTEIGELLWPERFGPDELEALKVTLGTLASAGQLQQRPSALEGEIIKRTWIQTYEQMPPRFDEKGIFCDLTFKDGTTTDFAVIECWGRIGTRVYLIDQIRARMDFPAQVQAIREMTRRHSDSYGKYIEEAANGAAVIATLQNEIMGLIPVKPRTSKEARLAAVSPYFEAGNVYYPSPKLCPWVEVNIAELLAFPNGKHDDCCDVASMAVFTLGQVGSSISKLEALTRL